MKPLYNLTDPFFDLHEWKILSQAALENIPVAPSFVITKEAFKIGLNTPEINKQLKSIYAKLADDASSNMNIYACTNGEYKFHITKKGFDAFIDELNILYNTLRVKRDDDEFSLIVQRNIIAESSGIMFTSEVETNNNHVCTIEALYGQESLFKNQAEGADKYSVNKDQEIIVDKYVTKQEKMIVTGPDDALAQVIEISPRWQSKQKLDDRHILMLMEIAKYLEENFAKDLEVRWSYEGGKLYIMNIQKRIPLINIPSNNLNSQEIDLGKIIDEAPEIDIVPTIETIDVVQTSKDENINTSTNQTIETPENTFIPQFLKSETELEEEERHEVKIENITPINTPDIHPIYSAPVSENLNTPVIQKDKEIKDIVVSKVQTITTQTTREVSQIEAKSSNQYKEEILIKGLGVSGNAISGIVTKDAKNTADILVIDSITSITKKEAVKFEGFVIDNLVDKIPDFLKNKVVISSTNIGTKLIKEGEYIKINGKNGIVYELAKKTEEVKEQKIEVVQIKEKVVEIKKEKVIEIDKPQNVAIKEVIVPVKEEKIIKTATKVFLKADSQINDNDNYAGFISQTKNLSEVTKNGNIKTILVQTSSQIEKDSEKIKSFRNSGNKNIWLVLPKVTRFNEIESYRKRISGLRRSSTFKIFGYVATPANALLVDKYIDYVLDGLYVDLKSLKAGLIGEKPTEDYKLPGQALIKCLQEISSKTKKKKFSVFLDIDGFKITKSLVHEIFELGFSNLCARKDQIERLKMILCEEEKTKILKSFKGIRK